MLLEASTGTLSEVAFDCYQEGCPGDVQCSVLGVGLCGVPALLLLQQGYRMAAVGGLPLPFCLIHDLGSASLQWGPGVAPEWFHLHRQERELPAKETGMGSSGSASQTGCWVKLTEHGSACVISHPQPPSCAQTTSDSCHLGVGAAHLRRGCCLVSVTEEPIRSQGHRRGGMGIHVYLLQQSWVPWEQGLCLGCRSAQRLYLLDRCRQWLVPTQDPIRDPIPTGSS